MPHRRLTALAALVVAVTTLVLGPTASYADRTPPTYLVRGGGDLPVGPAPTVPYLRGGSLDDDGFWVGRDLVDRDLVIPVAGRVQFLARSGAGYLVVERLSRLLRVERDGSVRQLARGADGAVVSRDGRRVALDTRSGVRVVDASNGQTTARLRLADSYPAGFQGRRVVVARATGTRESTALWDPRSGRVVRVAPGAVERTDPSGRLGVSVSDDTGDYCETLTTLTRPVRRQWRTCGPVAGIDDVGPGNLMLTQGPGPYPQLRSQDGTLVALFSTRTPAGDDLLLGLAGSVSDSRWESGTTVLLGVDATPPGSATDLVGIARCSVAGCEWAGAPWPVS